MRIDLHTHTRCSDGTDTPTELLEAAAQADLDVVAITDHDTTRGWAQAATAAEQVGVGLVRGIEISCQTDHISVHLLGYLIDPQAPGLFGEIERARESRVTRARRMVERIGEDYGLTWDEVVAQAAAGATIGRPHIADALVARGDLRDRSAAFAGILRTDSPYYVSYYAPDPVDAVRLVREAGGVPVMAHPFASVRGRIVGDDVIVGMASAGLAGLEACHRDHTAAQRQHASDLADRLGLFTTGSSDYHGAGKPNRLGENTTRPDVLAAIEQQASSGVEVIRP